MSFRIPYRGAGIAFLRKTDNSFEIFMGKRSRFPFFASWTVPGGSVELKYMENDITGAKREFNEETGLELNWEEYKQIGSWVKKLPLFQWTTFFYICNEDFSEAKPNEFFKLKWVDNKNLKKLYRRPFTKSEMDYAEKFFNEYFCKDHR